MVRVRKLKAIISVIVLVVLGLVCWIGIGWYSESPSLPKTESEAEAEGSEDDRLPQLVTLEPGMILTSQPPAGWSTRVIQSILHLASGDVDSLPSSAKVTATKFRTVVLADVRLEPSRTSFRLNRVGIGLSLIHHEQDTVISSATLSKQGISLSTIDGMVFARAEKALGRSHLIARTPTFALYETFVELEKSGGKHQSILLRYAMIVDPQTGKLRTAYWPVAEVIAKREQPESLTLLPDNYVYQCGIHVLARRLAGVALSWGFAMTELPPGDSIPMSSSLKQLSIQDFGDQADAEDLERLVRAALDATATIPSPPRSSNR